MILLLEEGTSIATAFEIYGWAQNTKIITIK